MTLSAAPSLVGLDTDLLLDRARRVISILGVEGATCEVEPIGADLAWYIGEHLLAIVWVTVPTPEPILLESISHLEKKFFQAVCEVCPNEYNSDNTAIFLLRFRN